MTIDPGSVYDSLTFYLDDKQDPLWTIHGPLLGDLLAGLIAGLEVLLDDLFTNFKGHYEDPMATITTQDKRAFNIYFSVYYDMKTILDAYRHIKAHIGDEKSPDGYVGEKRLNVFCWWIKDMTQPKIYKLFVFKTPEFIQGFITICSAFKVDYRNYVLGKPFKYIRYTDPPIYYNIEE